MIFQENWLKAKAKQIQEVYDKYENIFGRQPTDEKAAAELNLSVEEFQKRLTKISGYNLVSMEEMLEENKWFAVAPEKENPETAYEFIELKKL